MSETPLRPLSRALVYVLLLAFCVVFWFGVLKLLELVF